ncbi:MAG: hypothetical protein QOG04_1818 [Actinomycetota bacterium]|jgi:uncharacterized protein (TIGR03084 family)|nr:hypothetical protein [Actinomycetota bacterium]
MPDLDVILSDLAAEHAALDALVADLDDAGWESPTPAEGWNVRDQVGHLAFFDEQAALALADKEGFAANLVEIAKDVGAYMDRSVQRGRELGNEGVLEWWRSARTSMLDASRGVDPKERIPWYGPPMSPASFISARMMETWAHGQDVADTFDITRETDSRIKHVAHLCVLSRRHAYATNGLEEPTSDVFVVLGGPDGETWSWGDQHSADRISGTAEEFCLVVTQRRHLDDTTLTVEGDDARGWMAIAQAFAGPPGSGRQPGQFPKR